MQLAKGTTNRVKTNVAKVVESETKNSPAVFYKAGLSIAGKEVAKITSNMIYCWCENCKCNQVMKRTNVVYCTECNYIISTKV